MKARTAALALAFCFLGATVCLAQENVLGTWQLNEAKSKLGAGAGKNTTVVYEAAGDSIKVTVDGVDASGNPVHSEWTGKFDGKPYPVTGGAAGVTRTYTRINARTMSFVMRAGRKVSVHGRIVYAADGKSRTVTYTSPGAGGKMVRSVAVYDKQ